MLLSGWTALEVINHGSAPNTGDVAREDRKVSSQDRARRHKAEVCRQAIDVSIVILGISAACRSARHFSLTDEVEHLNHEDGARQVIIVSTDFICDRRTANANANTVCRNVDVTQESEQVRVTVYIIQA